jgi:3',5'-cyclic AMP phosphodiesterase CpdA
MTFKKTAFLFLCALVLVGCRYEVSPWETDPHCSQKVSIAYNIERLKQFEQKVGTRTEYQVVLVSDPQAYPKSFDRIIQHINGMENVDFILLTGDLADSGLKTEFEWVCDIMEKSDKPIFVAIGNHDSLAFGKKIWAKTFGPTDYSFTYQNSKFIGYNDNQYEFANVPDRDWLKEQTAQSESRDYTFVFSHIPPWDKNFSQELKDMDVDLSLHGHTHNYRYWQYSEVKLPHFVTANTQKAIFGLLTVSQAGLTVEHCINYRCETAQLENR